MVSVKKWILVEWDNGTYDVVNVKAVQEDIMKPNELTTGKVIAVLIKNGVRESATVVMSSDDFKFLYQQKCYMTNLKLEYQVAGPSNVREPSINTRNELSDDSCRTGYSPKETSTSESSTNAVKVVPQTKRVDVGASTDVIFTYEQKSQTDCTSTTEIMEYNTRLIKALQTAQRAYLMSVVDTYGPSIMSHMDINNDEELDIIFNIVNKRVNRIKSPQVNFLQAPHINYDPNNGLNEESDSQQAKKSYHRKRKLSSDQHSDSNSNISCLETTGSNKNTKPASEASRSKQAKSPSTHRSNKPPDCEPSTSKGRRSTTKTTPVKHSIVTCYNSASPGTSNTMVPLGSGHTVISRSEFNQIKWSSHSIATRQLLTAVFPRSVLATHSLTGKRSPAFQDLPPKRCLDQRKVADIILTVTKMCKVKENLVRAAITVKCADEDTRKKRKETKETEGNSLNSSTNNLNQSWYSDQENQPMN